MKRLIVTVTALACFLAACAHGEENLACVIHIYTAEKTVLDETSVSFADGDTVSDVLKKTAREKKIQMELTGVGATAYVRGIDNTYEFDMGPGSGWIYYVNDEYVDKSCGQYRVGDGDVIRWEYITGE